MVPRVLVVLVGLLYLQVSHATTCYETNDNSGFTATVVIYCEESEVCCGTERNRECCGDDGGDVIAIIVGCVVGVVLFVIVLTIVICVVKNNKRGQKGAVVRPHPVASGAVNRQSYPYNAPWNTPRNDANNTKLQPLNHNYAMPQGNVNTTGVPTTLNMQIDTVPPIVMGPSYVPPAFNYIPPQYAPR